MSTAHCAAPPDGGANDHREENYDVDKLRDEALEQAKREAGTDRGSGEQDQAAAASIA